MSKYLNRLNEGFDRFVDNIEDNFDNLTRETVCTCENDDLRAALEEAAEEVSEKILANPQDYPGFARLKQFEFAFQEAINKIYPDVSWWDVTGAQIFMDLLNGMDIEEVIDDIINQLKPGYCEPVCESVSRLTTESVSAKCKSGKCKSDDEIKENKCRSRKCKSSEKQLEEDECCDRKSCKGKDKFKKCCKDNLEVKAESCRRGKCKDKATVEEEVIKPKRHISRPLPNMDTVNEGRRCRRAKIDEINEEGQCVSVGRRSRRKADAIKENDSCKKTTRRTKAMENFARHYGVRMLHESVEEVDSKSIYSILSKAFENKSNVELKQIKDNFSFTSDFVKKWAADNGLNTVEIDIDKMQFDSHESGKEVEVSAKFVKALDKKNSVVIVNAGSSKEIDGSIKNIIKAIMNKKFSNKEFEIQLDNIVMVVLITSNSIDFLSNGKVAQIKLTESIMKNTFNESHRRSIRKTIIESMKR